MVGKCKKYLRDRAVKVKNREIKNVIQKIYGVIFSRFIFWHKYAVFTAEYFVTVSAVAGC